MVIRVAKIDVATVKTRESDRESSGAKREVVGGNGRSDRALGGLRWRIQRASGDSRPVCQLYTQEWVRSCMV